MVPTQCDRMRRGAAALGRDTTIFAALTLAAWAAGAQSALSVFPDWPPITANSGLMMGMCGASLWLLAREKATARAVLAGRLLAWCVLALAAGTGLEYLLGRDLGLDPLLFQAPPSLVEEYPGRPAPHSVVSYGALSVALLVLDRRWRGRRAAPALAVAAGAVAVLAILGHLFAGTLESYGEPSLFPHNEMAFLAAVAILLQAAGVMAARPEEGWAAVVASEGPGGVAARAMLGGLVMLIPLAAVVAAGQRLGLYSGATAAAAVTLLALLEGAILTLRVARQLDRADAARRRAEQRRAEVIAMTSHELQNPLTTTLLAVRSLREGDYGELPAVTHMPLSIAENAVRRMIRLIQDYLDLEKLEAGAAPMRRERVELRPLLEEAAASAAAGSPERVRARCPGGLCARGDRDRLLQVVINLTSNALKFSPGGKPVELAAHASAGGVRVTVRDHGPGIPPDFRAKVFTRFSRAPGQQARGYGLGLTISKAIVEELGGRIGFEDARGGGTVFFFEVPAWQRGVPEKQAARPGDPGRAAASRL